MRGGRDRVDEAQDDLRAFGAPDEFIEQLQGEETDFEIEPDNWPTVEVWARVQTQWRSGFSGFYGLDYVAVDVVLRRLRIEDEEGDLFARLQVMEIAALQAMAKQKG